MGVTNKTIYKCDCCGIESEKSDFNDGLSCGSANLSITGNWGGKAYDGAWGGSSFEIKQLLCFNCSEKLRDFYSKLKTESTKK